ncbi:phthiocerol/phthiodiolone dimycocerosyl transferase family protein [Dapis sp. BLCC M229]|uniref:phthiocerol/phthiodiolone dimycocerosyl transferase family protein n=1 Tax=Dapis sp. BLCC M229 TaxID=3400188 RepID=UPI003CF62A3A
MVDERKLIAMEEGMELFNRYANSLNVVIISQIKGFLDREVLRKSLDLVQIRHPRLNSHIVEVLDNLMFKTEGTKQIPLKVVLNPSPEYWHTLVINELSTKIDSEKVLLRATLIKASEKSTNNYLITTIHHAIADAMCGIYLHSEIISFCHKIASNYQITQVNQLESYQSLEKIIANYTVENEELPKLNRQIDTLPFEKYVPHQQRRCGLIQKQLNTDITEQIIERSRQEKSTVHGAICSAMMLALAKQLKKENKDFYFSCRSSVDIRRRVYPPIGDENIAMLVSALNSFHTVNNKTSFWDLARQVKSQIKARLKTPEIYNVILSYREGTKYILNNPERSYFSIFVTNIGKVKISSDYGLFKLEKISYAVSLNVLGSVFSVAVSTFENKMILNFIYSQPILSQDTVNALVNSTISILSCVTY